MALVYSYSNLSDYENCPKKFNHKHIAKDCTEIKSFQQTSGISVHDAIRKRVKLHEPLPENFAGHEPVCATIDAHPSIKHCELSLGMTYAGAPCGFFADNVWFRGKLDLAMVQMMNGKPAAVLVDWKNGKPWEDVTELRYQALLLRVAMPELQQITGFYYWLRTGAIGQLHNVGDTVMTWNKLHQTVDSVERRMNSGDWPADDNPLCRYCPVTKAQCQYKRDPPA